jgi:hypothetical protein
LQSQPKRKIVFKKFPTLQKNKTPNTQARQKSTRQMTETDDIKMVVTHDRQERQPITAPTKNWRFSASYDSFLVKQTVVLCMKICGENRQLLVAAKRQAVKKLRFSLNYIKIYRCIIQYRHPKQACFLSSNF